MKVLFRRTVQTFLVSQPSFIVLRGSFIGPVRGSAVTGDNTASFTRKQPKAGDIILGIFGSRFSIGANIYPCPEKPENFVSQNSLSSANCLRPRFRAGLLTYSRNNRGKKTRRSDGYRGYLTVSFVRILRALNRGDKPLQDRVTPPADYEVPDLSMLGTVFLLIPGRPVYSFKSSRRAL